MFFDKLCCTFTLIIILVQVLYYIKSSTNQLLKKQQRNVDTAHYGDLSMENDRAIANKLEKEIRILCWVSVTKKTLARAKLINETWGKRCTTFLLMGDSSTAEVDGVVPLIGTSAEMADNNWDKVKGAYFYIVEHHIQYMDWVLKVEPDTYVIVENLRHLLSKQNIYKPNYLGYKINCQSVKFNDGESGYVLNKLAVKILVGQLLSNNKCQNGFSSQSGDDMNVGFCLSTMGISPSESIDDKGKNVFFSFQPYIDADLAVAKNKGCAQTSYTTKEKSLDRYSETVVSFRWVPENIFYTMEYVLYHTQVFGIVTEKEEFEKNDGIIIQAKIRQ